MSNAFLNALNKQDNYKTTENGAVALKSTLNEVYDMFAFGAAYRTRSDADVILLFKNAYEQDPLYALKCLFYLRDARGGQGERRFWRLCAKWLAQNYPDVMRHNMKNVPEYGRWDDLYIFIGTPVEKDAFRLIKEQLALDVQCKTPSLLAKWLKSENTSSPTSRLLGTKTRCYLNMTPRQYRKVLSALRKRINVLERLMSANQWDKIEFDKIPSKAGFVYRNAFARHDVERMRAGAEKSYENFAKDKNTKVNAKTLYPYEVVSQAYNYSRKGRYWEHNFEDTERLMINKYWDNLANYFNNASLNALAVVDTSGSMWGVESAAPINVAISLGLYCAEKAKGPFHGNYISFSRNPQLIKTSGIDFVDRVYRIYSTNLCENTNLEGVFDLVLKTAQVARLKQSDLPANLIIISDMEIDQARGIWSYDGWYGNRTRITDTKTTMQTIRDKWNRAGYKMPHLIYWNVQARQNTILDDGPDVSYVSGMSPSIFQQIMTNKTGLDLMLETLNGKRYEAVTL